MRASQILEIDGSGTILQGAEGKPSAETLLHLEVIRSKSAGAVMHTHSVWTTVLSDYHHERGGFHIEGYEMLKGLSGVTTHRHREWVPILENDQDMPRLAAVLGERLAANPGSHAVLLRGHGLYSWGATIDEAERHVEVFEFLLEAAGRRTAYGHRHHP